MPFLQHWHQYLNLSCCEAAAAFHQRFTTLCYLTITRAASASPMARRKSRRVLPASKVRALVSKHKALPSWKESLRPQYMNLLWMPDEVRDTIYFWVHSNLYIDILAPRLQKSTHKRQANWARFSAAIALDNFSATCKFMRVEFHHRKVIQLSKRNGIEVVVHTRNFDLEPVARFVQYLHIAPCKHLFHNNARFTLKLHLDSGAEASFAKYLNQISCERRTRNVLSPKPNVLFSPRNALPSSRMALALLCLPGRFQWLRTVRLMYLVRLARTTLNNDPAGPRVMSRAEIDQVLLKTETFEKMINTWTGRYQGVRDVVWVARAELKYAASLMDQGITQLYTQRLSTPSQPAPSTEADEGFVTGGASEWEFDGGP